MVNKYYISIILKEKIKIMSVMMSRRRSVNPRQFKDNANKIEGNKLNVEPSQAVVANQLQKNRITYMYPASIAAAKVHRQAIQFGYNPKNEGQPPQVCACCQERVDTRPISLCYSTTSISEEQELGHQQFQLPLGVALFFYFIKIIIFYLIFRALICDIFNIITNVTKDFCQGDSAIPCQPTTWNHISIMNKKDDQALLLIQQILDLVVVVLSIIVFFCIRKKQYRLYEDIRRKNKSQEHYTIMVSNIPLIDFPSNKQLKKHKGNRNQQMQLWHRNHLWKFFQKKVKTWLKNQNNWKRSKGTNQYDFLTLKEDNNNQLRSSDIVTSISLCYNLNRLQNLREKRDDLVNHKQKYEKLRNQIEEQISQADGEHNNKKFGAEPLDQDIDTRFSTIPKQVDFLGDCQIVLNKQYANDNSVLFNMTNLVGTAFVSFQYPHYKQFILDQASRNLYYNGAKLHVQPAQAPEQINWTNFRHAKSKQRKRQATTWSFMFIIILINYLILTALQYYRLSNQKFVINPQGNTSFNMSAYLMVFAMIASVLITNKIILYLVRYFVSRENHTSTTYRITSEIKTTVIGQFINSAIAFLVVSRIFGNYFGAYTGLVYTVTFYVIIKCVISLLISIIYPSALFKSIGFCLKYRNMDNEDSVQKFQIQLNHDYENQRFDLTQRYIEYLSLFLFASFYFYLVPIINPILIIFYFLSFWLDKFNLFRRSSLDFKYNFGISRTILKIFQASIFVFALGATILGIYVKEWQFSLMHFIALCIAFLYFLFLIFMPNRVQRKFFGNYQSSERQIYDDCVAQGKFQKTYWTTNPATYLVKESQVIGRKSIYNPIERKVYVTDPKQNRNSKV